MKSNTYHQSEVRHHLVKYLTEAREQIHLAIGWLDDNGLVGLLQKKAMEGLEVRLILIKDIEDKSAAATYQQLTQKGVQVIYLDNDNKEQLIDHKFGVIDASVVLTGNYGWGYKKAAAEFWLTVTEDLPSLAQGFEHEFEYLSIVNQLSRNEPKPNNTINGLLKKLSVIKTLLGMGDTEFIHLRLKELDNFKQDANIALIYQHLSDQAYDDALELTKEFIQYHQYLQECIDPPIDNLRREIKLLEEDISSISNEYSEAQKTMHKFSKVHTVNLGDLLQKILFQSKIKAEIEAKADADKQDAFEEAQKDHEEYTKSHELAKQQKLAVLTPQEQKELKKLYRQTSLKCHPDRVVEELHDQAEELFVELNEAYKANNLERIREISQQLKSGVMLSKSESITTLKKLESTYKTLHKKFEDWQEKLNQLKAMPTYQTINGIDDWETYFKETKTILENQLKTLMEFNEAEV